MSGLKHGVGGFVFGLRGAEAWFPGVPRVRSSSSYQGSPSALMREPLRHDRTIGDDSAVISHRSDR